MAFALAGSVISAGYSVMSSVVPIVAGCLAIGSSVEFVNKVVKSFNDEGHKISFSTEQFYSSKRKRRSMRSRPSATRPTKLRQLNIEGKKYDPLRRLNHDRPSMKASASHKTPRGGVRVRIQCEEQPRSSRAKYESVSASASPCLRRGSKGTMRSFRRLSHDSGFSSPDISTPKPVLNKSTKKKFQDYCEDNVSMIQETRNYIVQKNLMSDIFSLVKTNFTSCQCEGTNNCSHQVNEDDLVLNKFKPIPEGLNQSSVSLTSTVDEDDIKALLPTKKVFFEVKRFNKDYERSSNKPMMINNE